MKNSLKLARYSSPLLLVALLGGCGRSGSSDEDGLVTAKGAALHQAVDCDDLLLQIQSDAITKLDHQVELFKEAVSNGGGAASGVLPPRALDSGAVSDQGGDGDGDGDGAFDSDTSADEKTVSAPGEGSESDGSTEGAPDGHSETNTQVEDVDEADIVKIAEDGERLYVLHGNSLKIVDAWPADKTEELGATEVEGEPFELFVKDGKATVFSRVYPSGVGEKGEPAGDSIRSTSCIDCCYYGGEAFTQITVFDVMGDVPTVARQLLFEGNYVSSRRHDDVVRAIVQGGFSAHDIYYPNVEFYDSFGREKDRDRISDDLDGWRDGVATDIRSTKLDDWVPRRFERENDAWNELPVACDGYFIPEPGLVAGGVTQVVTLLPGSTEAPHVTSVLGGAQHVYANQETMVLAQTDWRWDQFGEGGSSRSSIHEFSIEGSSSSYEASGFAPGYLKNQFAIDERNGVIRLSTTEDVRTDPEDNPWMTEPKNTIITLGKSDGELLQLDRTEPMGEPGETIFSTRFMGDRAYVVTFRQTDPLFAVDISDAEDLRVLGELHIPGFSDYIHPLGEDHLLTIGQDVGDEGEGGVALQIFDVSDATSPQLTHKEVFGGFSYSEANHNHKAFTYVKDYFDSEEDLLLFPLVTYEPNYQAGLEVLQVSQTDGFQRMGTIDHAPLLNNDCASFEMSGAPCYYYGGNEMRRGMQIDEYIYALGQGGITVHQITELDAGPVATVPFERPQFQGCGYYESEEWEDDLIREEGDTDNAPENDPTPSDDLPDQPDTDLPAMGGTSGK